MAISSCPETKMHVPGDTEGGAAQNIKLAGESAQSAGVSAKASTDGRHARAALMGLVVTKTPCSVLVMDTLSTACCHRN